MLIQRFTNHVRLVTQEQHALLSGVLAEAWSDGGRADLHPLLRQAIGLHDNPWRAADRSPRLDPDSGDIHDFISIPDDQRLLLYGGGLDQLERVDPYIAALVSLHYTRFSGTIHMEELQKQETRRRERLASVLGFSSAERLERALATDLAWLQFFDAFSLWICLTMPGIDPEQIPSWIAPERWAHVPDTDLHPELDWLDSHTIRIHPFPFREPFRTRIYHRRLPRRPWTSPRDLEDTWQQAALQAVAVSITS